MQPGGVPIIVGGHVLGAARRAARVGDGFFPMKTQGARLGELLGRSPTSARAWGAIRRKIEITAAAPGPDLDAIRRLEDQGVSRLVLVRRASAASAARGPRALADAVLAKL